jgi:aryl-alcohol dehydrogenase-like predicted oxidoreductase
MYSNGLSEEIIGEALHGKRKGDVLLATKVRFPMGTGPNEAGLSRHHLIKACEESLKRLKTDAIDIYQAHQWDGKTPLEETIDAFDTLVRQGKVRYIGCSNFSGWHLMKALWVSEQQHKQRFVSQQVHYTLESRDAEYELIPIAVDQGLGVLVWAPLAAGLLTGKHRRNAPSPEGTRQFAGWTEPPIRDEDRLWNIVDTVVDIAQARGVSGAQVALAWTLGRPAVTSVIVGARNADQIGDSLGAADLRLTDEERARLDRVSAPAVLYPYWHQLANGKDRFGAADLSFFQWYLDQEAQAAH